MEYSWQFEGQFKKIIEEFCIVCECFYYIELEMEDLRKVKLQRNLFDVDDDNFFVEKVVKVSE